MSSTSTSARPPSSPPPSICSPTTTTTNAHPSPPSSTSNHHNNSNSSHQHHYHIHPTLPSAETQRHVAEARAAIVASMGNMVDRELQSRAAVLHDNARALDRQERDVVAATGALRRERERLGREADGAARRLKELGNVQNWAEVLERQFLVLEETVRLANGGSDDDDDDDGGSSGSCSCSDCGRGEEGVEEDDDGDDMAGKRGGRDDTDGQDKVNAVGMMALDADGGVHTAWSDTSRSLNEPESSTGTGMAKGSETASVSTSS